MGSGLGGSIEVGRHPSPSMHQPPRSSPTFKKERCVPRPLCAAFCSGSLVRLFTLASPAPHASICDARHPVACLYGCMSWAPSIDRLLTPPVPFNITSHHRQQTATTSGRWRSIDPTIPPAMLGRQRSLLSASSSALLQAARRPRPAAAAGVSHQARAISGGKPQKGKSTDRPMMLPAWSTCVRIDCMGGLHITHPC